MILRRNKSYDDNESESGHYWISISDLMTSLLFIFILILAYVIFTFHNKSQQYEQNREARINLLQDINKTLYEEKITQISIDTKKGSLRVSSGILFEQGEYHLKPNAKIIIEKIGAAIKYHINKNSMYKSAINTIFIEGHTDSDELFAKYNNLKNGKTLLMTNKELSTFRAIEVFNVMDVHTKISEMTSSDNDNNKLFSYSGYADTRPAVQPVNEKFTEDAKAQNRRIEFFFALSAPKVE